MHKKLSTSFASNYLVVRNHHTQAKKSFFVNFFGMSKFGDVDRNSTIYACDIAIEGTMKIHCIYALNKTTMTQLLVKYLAYFFAKCLDG